MPSHSSKTKDHDFTTVALHVVEQAIGEKWDGWPLHIKDAGKNPAGSSTPNERSVWGIFASIAEFEASTPSRKLRKPTDPKCPKVFQPLSRKTQADRQKDFVGAATSPHGL